MVIKNDHVSEFARRNRTCRKQALLKRTCSPVGECGCGRHLPALGSDYGKGVAASAASACTIVCWNASAAGHATSLRQGVLERLVLSGDWGEIPGSTRNLETEETVRYSDTDRPKGRKQLRLNLTPPRQIWILPAVRYGRQTHGSVVSRGSTTNPGTDRTTRAPTAGQATR